MRTQRSRRRGAVNDLTGPRVATVAHADLLGGTRLDASYYQDDFVLARLRVTNTSLETVPLAGEGGLVKAWVPSRTTLTFTASPEEGIPYLRAHDALERIPPFERYVLLERMKDGDRLLLKRGWIVLTCSGRNFGPCAYVDRRLAQAAMTDIMRLEPATTDAGLYALAFLTSHTGQTMIRRDPAGSVINHLGPPDLARIPVPIASGEVYAEIVARMKQAVALCEEATETVLAVDSDLRDAVGLDPPAGSTWPTITSAPRVSTCATSDLASRLDAEYYSARHARARLTIAQSRHDRLDAVAELTILGRYKRYYVNPPHGTPILSSGQLHQFRPVALKNISDRSFADPARYRLKRGWSVIACDGRAEGDLGRPGYVGSLWDGWMASNHLLRLVPRPDVHRGYLHAALRTQEVQVQLKAVATGSVVDALDENVSGGVLIPRLDKAIEADLGVRIDAAYEMWADAYLLQSSAADLLEAEIDAAYEGHRAPSSSP